MPRFRIELLLAISLLPQAPAWAQRPDMDRHAIADAADRAAAEAERAAAEAERAMIAARQAAQAARAAANSARALAGGGPARLAADDPAMRTPALPPPDENLPVLSLEQREFASAIPASVANGPNESALKSTAFPDVQLVATSKDKVASLAWTIDVSGQPAPGRLSAQQLTLTASGKLNDSGDAQLFGLDGLPNGNELKLVFTRYDSRINLTGREKRSVAEARTRCLGQPGASAAGCNPYDYPTGVSSFVAKYYPAGLRSLLKEVLPGPVWFYGAGLSANQASFKYLDRASFSLKKEEHFGFGGSAFGGIMFNAGQTAVIGSFDYKRAFRENDPVTLCQPIEGTSLTQCITSPDGAPNKVGQKVLALELRHSFPAPIGSFASLAIAPKFSVDLDHDAYSLAVPLYFAGDGAGKLRGGVRGVYLNSEQKDGTRVDDFTLGLFVGVPFSLFRD